MKVQRLDPRAVLPARAHPGDAGLDLCALDEGSLQPGERAVVPTGIAIGLDPGQAALVLPRSGNAMRHGIAVVNAPGLIDEGYRGEIRVLLLNTDQRETFTWEAGARVAQLVVIDVATTDAEEVDSLDETTRGAGGFGSTGV